ncbi:MAG: S9 family peptidase [Actinomycetota bacterium]
MTERKVAPFGSWTSPITADLLARSGVWLSLPIPQGDATHWLEGRPAEGGRYVVVRSDPSGAPADVTPDGFNARSKVHEYGGGSYWVDGGAVFFTNFEDQRLYRQDPSGEPVPITPEPPTPGSVRYADARLTEDGRLIVCVRERHEVGVTNELVALPADGSADPWIIAGGHDFYAFPRISPDGSRLTWTSWDHPRMPWDGTELWVGELTEDGTLRRERRVAGGDAESIFQPEWSPDGALHFVSDRTGWWNLYRERDGEAQALAPREAEFGVPQWEFGYSTYAFLPDGRIACIYTRDGRDHLALLDPGTSELLDMDLPYSCYEPYLRSDGSRLVFVAGGPATPIQVVSLDLQTRAVEVLRESQATTLDPAHFSIPRPIEFPTEGGLLAHALFYPPASPDHAGPEGERPPLVVMSHGGPTGHVTAEFDLRIQFFTSRGLAVVDVNYGGSTGYGRDYRGRLRGQWGVVDTVDCINAAKHLVESGEVDGGRLAIRGGSAGGYTTLCALTFHDDFAVGASYFGLADLEHFAEQTHKFESRYLDALIGPWPQAADLWRARSPVRFAELLSCPVILLQGLEDEIVPPSQAEIMVQALGAKGLPYAYLAFEGEQHGFRKAENIKRAHEAELYFYSRVLGFDLADPVEPVAIENM